MHNPDFERIGKRLFSEHLAGAGFGRQDLGRIQGRYFENHLSESNGEQNQQGRCEGGKEVMTFASPSSVSPSGRGRGRDIHTPARRGRECDNDIECSDFLQRICKYLIHGQFVHSHQRRVREQHRKINRVFFQQRCRC